MGFLLAKILFLLVLAIATMATATVLLGRLAAPDVVDPSPT